MLTHCTFLIIYSWAILSVNKIIYRAFDHRCNVDTNEDDAKKSRWLAHSLRRRNVGMFVRGIFSSIENKCIKKSQVSRRV